MATNKNRLAKLEAQKRGDEGGAIRVFILDEDGGAWEVGGKSYTPKEYAEHKRQSAARGGQTITVKLDEDAPSG